MDADWQKARLEELWNDFVLRLATENGIPADIPRREMAMQLIDIHKKQYYAAIDKGDDDGIFYFLANARAIWQLLSIDVIEWTAKAESSDQKSIHDILFPDARSLLIHELIVHLGSVSPLHQKVVDPVSLVLPRKLVELTSDALQALQHGEVQQLVEPAKAGRHGAVWSREKAQLRAVQWVLYLYARGSRKEFAIKQVSRAVNVKDSTIRSWEDDFKQDIIKQIYLNHASQAGDLSFVLDENPRHAEGDGNSVDVFAYRLFLDLREEPLKLFGERARNLLGGRYRATD